MILHNTSTKKNYRVVLQHLLSEYLDKKKHYNLSKNENALGKKHCPTFI